jgi:hypothetical protein
MTAQTQLAPTNTNAPHRIVALVLGIVLALAGLGIGAVGGLFFGVFGSDETVASGSHPISTSQAALVSSVADISDSSDVAGFLGEPRIRFTARAAGTPGGLFIGIGPAAQVDRYLASVPIDEVTDFEIDPFKLTRRPRAGSTRPEPPATQPFWVAQGTGRDTATLRWKVRDGDYRLVLMNADAGRGIDVHGDVALTLAHVSRVAWLLVATGVLLVLGGVVVIILALRSRRTAAR